MRPSLTAILLTSVWLCATPLAAAPSKSTPAPAPAAPSLSPQQIDQALKRLQRDEPLYAGKVAAISALFVGARYQLSPLGEGPGAPIDADPLVRYDAFDCVTYVEQVMALSWQPDHQRASRQLTQIRYRDGRISYAARKHIMMAQWIPQNIRAGFVRDITARVAGRRLSHASLSLDQAAFESPKGKVLKLLPAERPLGTFSLPIIPLAHMPALIEHIPHGTIITSIRAAQRAVPYRASHVGLVIVQDGKRLIRHAHQPSGHVIEQPLADFVARSRRFHKWPVSGFNLLAIAERPPPAAAPPPKQ